nr:YEATS domain-containing protein 4-like isoform X2 [Loxodonta africana]
MGFREDVRQQDLRLLGSVSGVTVVTPIVYGNVARYFGQKREEDGHTRQRTVYIKPYRNEVLAPHDRNEMFWNSQSLQCYP